MLVFRPPGQILGPQLLWLPAILALHIALVASLGVLTAGINVLYRDVRYIVESLLVVLFWLSPILYDAYDVLAEKPPWMLVAYYLNPLAGIFEGIRSVLFHGTAPNLYTLGASVLVTLLIGVVGMLSFRRHERDFANLL
jgi:lipopolysaccharide transport system permease protein